MREVKKSPDSTSSGVNKTFSKLPPVPVSITEPYLVDTLDTIAGNVLPKSTADNKSGDDIIDKLNLLLAFYKLDFKAVPGCGEKYIRDALAVLVEEYNKNGK